MRKLLQFGAPLRSALPAVAAGLMALALPLAQAQSKAAALPTGTPPPALDPSYTPTLTFDVASIRENAGNSSNSLKVGVNSPVHSCRIEVTNFTVKSLVQLAYGFGTPVENVPDSLSDHYFNVQAKCDPAIDDKLAKLTDDQARMEKAHMLQVMLAERLGLKGHYETKETSVYLLEVAKGGPKLEEVKLPAYDPGDPNQVKPASAPNADVKATGGAQGLEFVVSSATMRSVAAMLVSQVNLPVIDKTGLTGSYKFTLQFGREWSAGNPESWPDIRTAAQEQLGLKLESTKAAVPVLIIDHIALPSAN